MNSDTPLTDAEVQRLDSGEDPDAYASDLPEFARKLERRLTQIEAIISPMHKETEKPYISTLNVRIACGQVLDIIKEGR